jgi:hypothetical protein
MSPKVPYVKRLAANLEHYWKIIEPLKSGTWWKEVRSLGEYTLEKILEPWSFPVFLISSHHEVNSLDYDGSLP